MSSDQGPIETNCTPALMIRFGEIFLKSEPVKKQFFKTMETNLRLALSESDDYTITITRERIIIKCPKPANILEKITKVFGIVDVSPAIISPNDKESLCTNAALLAAKHCPPGVRFAVRARREGVSGYRSRELAASAGDAIYETVPDLSVDLTTPEYELFIEARREGGLIYDKRVAGPGGLPYGTQGSVVSLISAGIDSPVATWLMMRRGVKPVFLFIDGENYAGKDVYQNVIRNLLALSLWAPGHKLSLFTVKAGKMYDRIMKLPESRLRCVICKHAMLTMAETMSVKREFDGIVMGDNLGQVATQTLKNLSSISTGINVQIYRPLLGYDKGEIIALARNIGTFCQTPGDVSCSVVPTKAATQSEPSVIEELMQKFSLYSLIDELLDDAEKISVKDGTIVVKNK